MNINAVVTTKQQQFPEGTVAGMWRFRLYGQVLGFLGSQQNTQPTMSFIVLNPDTYTVVVDRVNSAGDVMLGDPIEAVIVVPDNSVTIDVPNTITLTLS